MLHVYDQRFDVTKNLENFCELTGACQSAMPLTVTLRGREPAGPSLVSCRSWWPSARSVTAFTGSHGPRPAGCRTRAADCNPVAWLEPSSSDFSARDREVHATPASRPRAATAGAREIGRTAWCGTCGRCFISRDPASHP